MAPHAHCSTSPSSSCRQIYDVFLSFRGSDTRKKFTSHLYSALDNKGVRTFIDSEELHTGNKIGSALSTAIQQSRILIPVFSKNYASSKWCLQELCQILQCSKTNDQIILPIFFDVEPSDVRNQTKSIGEAFQEHEKDFKLEIVNKWREALREVGNLKGWNLKEVDNGDESKLVQVVVERALRELNNTPLADAKHPIGLNSRVEDLLSILCLESMDPKFVGICGMGGIGKTTIIKAVYNQIFRSFDGSSFLANVREQALQHMGLVCLQKQLLSDILGKQIHNISQVDGGSKLIEAKLKEKKVLIILDDVDHRTQLNALIGEIHWFGLGSRIIITTRDEKVLKVGLVDNNNIYKPQGLDYNQSLQLFSMHAFQRNQPPKDFMQLSRKVVTYAKGLPLTLEVLGSYLCNMGCKEEWESSLQKLEKTLPDEVQNKLKISYDGLEGNEKSIFLDTACFFIGMNKKIPIYFWESRGFFPNIGLKVLIQKSLVMIGDENEIRMHDQLRDMGRRIVYEESPNEPGERSRLWSCEDVMEVLKEHKGTRNVEGMFPNSECVGDCLRIEGLTKMSNLRLLLLDGVDLERNIEHLPSRLRWLSWQRCPLEILPANFYLEKLVVLDLTGSDITQAWNNKLQNKRFENLKVLNLTGCRYLAKSPDFYAFPRLEVLIFRGCEALVDVHESIKKLKRLTHLDMDGCTKLMELPCDNSMLHSLQELILSYCYQLEELPKSIGDLKSLVELKLDRTPIHELPNSIGVLSKLRCLSLWGCHSLKRICDSIGRIESLVNLNLGDTPIAEIPDAIGLLEKLETLNVGHCYCLKSLPKLPLSLISLNTSECISLERLPDLSNLKNLQKLCLIGCKKLVEIPGLEGVKCLEEVYMSRCMSLIDTPMEVLVQDWFNNQLYSFLEFPQHYVIGDVEVKDGIILCLVLELLAEAHKMEQRMEWEDENEDELLKGTLGITAHIHRNGKRITCMSTLKIEGILLNCQEIIFIQHFQRLNWFGFPLKVDDEVEIEKINWHYIFPPLNTEIFWALVRIKNT